MVMRQGVSGYSNQMDMLCFRVSLVAIYMTNKPHTKASVYIQKQRDAMLEGSLECSTLVKHHYILD